MNTKFSDQHDDQAQPLPEAPETSTTVEVENEDTTSSEAARDKTEVSRRWPGFVRAAASQDYIGVLVAAVVLTLGIGILHPDFLQPGQLLDHRHPGNPLYLSRAYLRVE